MLSCSGFSSLRRDVERDVQAPYGMQSCRIRNTLGEPLLALLRGDGKVSLDWNNDSLRAS